MKDLAGYQLIRIRVDDEDETFLVDSKLSITKIKKIINQCINEVNQDIKEGQEVTGFELISKLTDKGFKYDWDCKTMEFNIEDKFLSNKVLFKKLR